MSNDIPIVPLLSIEFSTPEGEDRAFVLSGDIEEILYSPMTNEVRISYRGNKNRMTNINLSLCPIFTLEQKPHTGLVVPEDKKLIV